LNDPPQVNLYHCFRNVNDADLQRVLLFALSYIFLATKQCVTCFCQLWSSESVALCLSVALAYHISVHLSVKSCFICTCVSSTFFCFGICICKLLGCLKSVEKKNSKESFFSLNWWNDEIHKDYATGYLIKDHKIYINLSFAFVGYVCP
jgi:hypothetical protein